CRGRNGEDLESAKRFLGEVCSKVRGSAGSESFCVPCHFGDAPGEWATWLAILLANDGPRERLPVPVPLESLRRGVPLEDLVVERIRLELKEDVSRLELTRVVRNRLSAQGRFTFIPYTLASTERGCWIPEDDLPDIAARLEPY